MGLPPRRRDTGADGGLGDPSLVGRDLPGARAARPVGWNINRSGVVFIQAVEGLDLDVLVRRTAYDVPHELAMSVSSHGGNVRGPGPPYNP